MLQDKSVRGCPSGSEGKESACNEGDLGLIPESGRSPGEGNSLLRPVFLPGEFHGQRSLARYSPCGHKESDMTEQLTHADQSRKRGEFSLSSYNFANTSLTGLLLLDKLRYM